jgi:hypothetical protein
MKTRIITALLITLFIPACSGTLEIGLEHFPESSSTMPAVPTLMTAPTVVPTHEPSPTLQVVTDVPLPTDVPAVSSVQIFMIGVDDNGQSGKPVGCGDSLIPVLIQIPPTQGVLRAALGTLLALKDQYYGESGLYNSLYQSDLQVESLSIQSGIATVKLTGDLSLGGECDNPRVQAQLEQTVLQFSTVSEAVIYINGRPLAEILSLK